MLNAFALVVAALGVACAPPPADDDWVVAVRPPQIVLAQARLLLLLFLVQLIHRANVLVGMHLSLRQE